LWPDNNKMDVSYKMIYEGFEKNVHNREKLEGNMFEGYSMQKAIEFYAKYMKILIMSINKYGMMTKI
jgi:hypothetical protein